MEVKPHSRTDANHIYLPRFGRAFSTHVWGEQASSAPEYQIVLSLGRSKHPAVSSVLENKHDASFAFSQSLMWSIDVNNTQKNIDIFIPTPRGVTIALDTNRHARQISLSLQIIAHLKTQR